MTIHKRAIESAQNDAQAFAVTRIRDRLPFIKRLASDPLTQAFDPSVVSWLITALEDARHSEEAAKRELYYREETPAPAKGKVIRKLAKIITAQSAFITEVDRLMDGERGESVESVYDKLVELTSRENKLIEDCKP